MLVDSHCHLDFPDLAAEGSSVIERARAAGIGRIVTICTKITEFPKVLAVAEAYTDVYCSVGIHPHDAGTEPETSAQRLAELAAHPRVVGIGETGLDYYYEHSPREAQARSFREHIIASRETGLPLIIHSRDADADMIDMLKETTDKGTYPAVLHCFSSGPALAWAAVELGMYVSFSGILTFKKSGELRSLAAELPLDRLLVETDSPYLAPVPKRGKRNEPAFVAHTAACLGEVRGLSSEDIASQTTENFFRLFSKVPRPEMAGASR